jgi:flagellar motor switch protein FliM
LPHITIEPIVERLNTKYMFSTGHDDEVASRADELESLLERVKVPVSAVVGRTRITVNDFVHLQKGDIIPLDSYTTSDMQIMVGSLPKFYAKPGISKGRNAIQITSLLEREDSK